MQSGREREVGEGGDVVVGEVDGILVLQRLFSDIVSVQSGTHREAGKERRRRGKEWKGKGKGGQTLATPRFSMAGILCPVVLVYDINGARLKKCSICSFQLTHL